MKTMGIETRVINASFLAGISELSVAFTPAGAWLGEHLHTIGYFGLSLIFYAGYHYLFKKWDENHSPEVKKDVRI